MAYISFYYQCAERGGKGMAQQTIVIFDFADWGLKNFSNAEIFMLVKNTQNCYPERLKRIFMINVPAVFSIVWKVIRPWIDARTAAKIQFCSDVAEMQELIDPANLEVQSLGEIPDGTGHWAPWVSEPRPAGHEGPYPTVLLTAPSSVACDSVCLRPTGAKPLPNKNSAMAKTDIARGAKFEKDIAIKSGQCCEWTWLSSAGGVSFEANFAPTDTSGESGDPRMLEQSAAAGETSGAGSFVADADGALNLVFSNEGGWLAKTLRHLDQVFTVMDEGSDEEASDSRSDSASGSQ